MFRNARMYRLESDWPDSEAAASEELAKASFTPCGPLTERSSGWIPVDTVTEGNDLLFLDDLLSVLATLANNVLGLRHLCCVVGILTRQE